MASQTKNTLILSRPSNDDDHIDGHSIVLGGQINMHKSPMVVGSLLHHLKGRVRTLTLNQNDSNNQSLQDCSFVVGLLEPPTYKGRVTGFSHPNRLYYSQEEGVRAAILVSSNVVACPMPEFTAKDISTCSIKVRDDEDLIFTSVYMDINGPVWPRPFCKLVSFCQQQRKKLIVTADTNCHSVLWNCPDSNRRGEAFEQLLLNSGLAVVNKGQSPTFFNRRSATIIDVTLMSHDLLDRVQDWRVSDNVVGSDHHFIEFTLTISITLGVRVRNWDLGAFDIFQKHLAKRVQIRPKLWTEETLELEATHFQGAIAMALEESHPPRRIPCSIKLPSWFDDEAHRLRRKLKGFSSRFRLLRTEEAFEKLKQARKAFSKHIRRAKRRAWQVFTTSCDSMKNVSVLNRIIQGQERHSVGILRREDNTFCADATETLDRLINTHFPGNHAAEDAAPPSGRHQCNTEDERVAFITPEKVITAINSFQSFKAPGPDDIRPIVLKHLGTAGIEKLTLLFRASALLGYIPTAWRTSRVIVIPKPGKADYSVVRSFRPISLSSFLLKTLERLWAWHLEATSLTLNPLCANQHAFRKGFSTESALSNMVEYIESAFIGPGFALAVFLDIQGAFDNVPIESILEGMRQQGLPEDFIQWYKALLTNQRIKAELLGSSVDRSLTRGTPQGGVLSPLAWNLAFESFLKLFEHGPVKVCGFADDAGLIVVGDEPTTLAYRMQQAIDKATSWGQQNGLHFSAVKTVAVLFTQKRKFQPPQPLFINGQELEYSDTVKYLGVTLDTKLTWRPHVKNKIKAGKKMLFKAKNALGKFWGPTPKRTLWLFTGIVRPMLTYGSLVWSRVCKLKTIQDDLRKLHRLSLLSVGHFRRSTPTAGLEVILGQPPLDLWIRMEAALGYRRTKGHRKLDAAALFTREPHKLGHRQVCRQFLADLDLQDVEEDAIPATFVWDRSFHVKLESLRTGDGPDSRDFLEVYTDGSRINGMAGAGVWIRKGSDTLEESYHLGTEATVFQAEVYAIMRAATIIQANWPEHEVVELYSDSQAAIQALANRRINSKLVHDCVTALNSASAGNRLHIKWIRAHVGHVGNEHADRLAKAGALDPTFVVEQFPSLPKSRVRHICKLKLADKWTRIWQQREDCRQTRQWFPEVNLQASRTIAKMDRRELSTVVQVITGHNFMNRHSFLLGDTDEEECRLCLEDEESTFHVIAECPALWATRQQVFGVHTLEAPLTWSTQMSIFLRGKTIGHLLGLGDLDQVALDIEDEREGELEG